MVHTIQLVFIAVNNSWVYSYRLLCFCDAASYKRKYNYIKILRSHSYTQLHLNLYKIVHLLRLALFLLMKFTESERWWIYSANPLVKKWLSITYSTAILKVTAHVRNKRAAAKLYVGADEKQLSIIRLGTGDKAKRPIPNSSHFWSGIFYYWMHADWMCYSP